MLEIIETDVAGSALVSCRLEDGRTAHVIPLTFGRAKIAVDEPGAESYSYMDFW